MKSPLERFLIDALAEFEKELESIDISEAAAGHRLRGAKQFAQFLLGKPRRKHERTTLGAEEL